MTTTPRGRRRNELEPQSFVYRNDFLTACQAIALHT